MATPLYPSGDDGPNLPVKKVPAAPSSSPSDRRGFFSQAAAVACGGFALLVPLASALVVFFDPLRRNGTLGRLIGVAPLDAVPDDGLPHQFPVVAQRVDAWNSSQEPIGAVYLRRQQGAQTIECLTATCPHAGCFVSFDPQSTTFRCPCHNSQFALDGAIIQPSPSPRAMDSLECQVRGAEILVKFEEFYSGRADKVVKG
jgi:nitrite reductase/ring-hydroxylating ferredoxin subunit